MESMVVREPPSLFRGPSATTEVLQTMVSSGHEPPGFQTQWTSISGVAPRSSVALEHQNLVHLLWAMSTIDRLNLYGLASAEHACRRMLPIQRAVRRSPKAPDFAGLETYMDHISQGTGALQAPKFDHFVASEQKDQAFILKQTRVAKEEEEAVAKTRKTQAGKAGKKDDDG